jgi:hypothetical protein
MEPWCQFDHQRPDDWGPDHGTVRSRLHLRRWPSGVALSMLELDGPDTDDGDDLGPSVFLDRSEDDAMTIEEAARVAADLTEAIALAASPPH